MNLTTKSRHSSTDFALQVMAALSLISEQALSHGLLGLVDAQYRSQIAHVSLYYRELLALLQAHFPNHSIIVLKGLSLTDRLYNQEPMRPLHDCDLLITSADQRREVMDFLIHHRQFRLLPPDPLSQYKHVLCLDEGPIDLVVEIHEKIFSHLAQSPLDDPEDELLFLIYHCVTQHTFLRLIWLVDIYLYFKQVPLRMDVLWGKAQELGLERSLGFCLQALNLVFSTQYKSGWLARVLITKSFLLEPKSSFYHYHAIKWLSKPNLFKAIWYYPKWLWFYIKR